MRRFASTFHCQSRAHCTVCRNFDGGRAWRQSIAAVYSIPGKTDFACPYGLPWGFVSPPRDQLKKLGAAELEKMQRIKAADTKVVWINVGNDSVISPAYELDRKMPRFNNSSNQRRCWTKISSRKVHLHHPNWFYAIEFYWYFHGA